MARCLLCVLTLALVLCRRTLDLLKDLADKATAEKVALQAEVKQRAAEAEALRVEKAALEVRVFVCAALRQKKRGGFARWWRTGEANG